MNSTAEITAHFLEQPHCALKTGMSNDTRTSCEEAGGIGPTSKVMRELPMKAPKHFSLQRPMMKATGEEITMASPKQKTMATRERDKNLFRLEWPQRSRRTEA
jgi:hypothetical protein